MELWVTWYHTTYKDTGQSRADAYPNRAPELSPTVCTSRIWQFFVEAVMTCEVSRYHEMQGWQLVPVQDWEARSRLLDEPFRPHEWRAILAMDAKYCDIRNRLTAEARERDKPT